MTQVVDPAAATRLHVLLVEDDAGVRDSLARALSEHGHRVDSTSTGEQALAHLATSPVDLVLLDLLLPGVDGIEVCRRLRETSGIPVIVVSGRDSADDVVAGLEAGADDYVTKPVVAQELSARMAALWRRVEPARGTVRVGPLEVAVDAGTAAYDGRALHLTRTELRLLAELAAHVGEVVSREQLLRNVWGYDYFGDTRLLDVHVRRLRTKLEPDPSAPRHLLTVRGTGYRLEP